MKFKLEIECDNAAFDPPNFGAEIVRILRDVTERVDYFQLEKPKGGRGNVRDANGNHVGWWELYKEGKE